MNESYRFKILRNGAEFAEIFPTSAPTLRMEASGEIKISLQGTFLDYAVDTFGHETEVNWLTDEIRPVLVLDGVEYTLATLIPTTANPERDATKRTISVQAYDRCWLMQDTKVEGYYHIAYGASYLNTVESLLTGAGIATIIKDASAATLANEREDWSTGDSYLTIANDLLSEINYNDLWFNADGTAMLQSKKEPRAANVQHVFTSKKTDKRISREAEIISISPSVKRSMDVFSVPNVFVVVCSNPDKSVMTATAVNDNPESPLSISRRGRRIVSVENVDNIASQNELQNYANLLRNQSMYTGEVIQITTRNLPGFGVNDISAINDIDVLGICVETAWQMQLGVGGTMSHTLERTVINLD